MVWNSKRIINPASTGIDGVAVTATTDSSWIPLGNYGQIGVLFVVTNVTGAAIIPAFSIEERILTKAHGGSLVTADRVTNTIAGGTNTLATETIIGPTFAAAIGTESKIHYFNSLADSFRITDLNDSAAAGGATDLFTVYFMLGS